MHRFKAPIIVAIATAAVTASVVGGIAIAQTTSPPVIAACVHSQTGNVRIVSSQSACKSNETHTTWNQQGEKGDPGVQGPQGEQGPQGHKGDNGANGLSGWQVVRGFVSVVAGGTSLETVECPAGKKVLGGGYVPNQVSVEGSAPAETGSGWEIYAISLDPPGSGVIRYFAAYAICATVSQ